MLGPLVDAWRRHEAGERPEQTPRPRAPPPHVAEQTWRFACVCGQAPWEAQLDAVWRDRQWQAPTRPCAQCHAWVEGHLIGE